MHIGNAVVDRMVDHGIDTVFGIPGKQTLPLNEAIGTRDDIQFVMARHETAVSHEAWGYAESSGRTAATVVVPGPGDLNATNGLKNALNDCTPLLHIAVETEPELRGGDAIHETPPDTYDNVVKENIVVSAPESTRVELDRAVAIANTPPKGPVRLGIPKNFLRMDTDLAETGDYDRVNVAGVPTEKVSETRELLSDADRPVIVAGGGVRSANAGDVLVQVAERLDAPVITTFKGKGVMPEDHPLFAGVLCGGASPDLVGCIEQADAMLAVGSDLDAVTFRAWSIRVPDALVHVTLHESDLGIGYDPQVGIVADAKAVLTELATTVEATDAQAGRDRAEAVRAADRDRLDPLLAAREPLTSVGALAAVREATPRDAIVTGDAGGCRIWMLVSFPVYEARGIVTPGSWASMGTGLPAAIGAQVANPETPVISIVGDGGVMMAIHELHTAAAEGIPVVVVVINNDDYAIISEEAAADYALDEGAYDWTDAPIAFDTVAEGMGVDAAVARTPADIKSAVGDAIASDQPSLVEIKTDPREPQATTYMRE